MCIKRMNKILSIIIPVYNPNLEHFSRCIDSIYSQISDEIEVIIVDDASTDLSFMDILKGKDYIILRNETNLKAGLSRQRGLDYSKADFVTFVDQDDELVEGKLQYMLERLKSSGCELVYMTRQLVAYDYNYKENGYCFEESCEGFVHGVFFNRQGLIDYGIRFSDSLKGSEDTYFMAQISSVIYHNIDNPWLSMSEPDVTYIWYLWEDSTSHTLLNDTIYFVETFDTYVDCHIKTLEYAKEKWNQPEYYVMRSLGVLVNIYFYVQYYIFTQEITEKMKSEAIRYAHWLESFLDMSKTEIMDMIKQYPEIYYETFRDIQKHYIPFIPERSLQDWLFDSE